MSTHCMIHLEMGDVVTAKIVKSAKGALVLHICLDDDAAMLIHKDWTPGEFDRFCEVFKVGQFAPKEEESGFGDFKDSIPTPGNPDEIIAT